MKSKKAKITDHDPWRDLVADETMTSVPLGQVFASMRVPAQQAGAVKDGLLEELLRLTDCESPSVDRGGRKA